MPWHTKLARDAGVEESDLIALPAGLPLGDTKLEALSTFTRQMVRERGKVSERMLDNFTEAGCTSQQVLEVILAVAIKTMSNYTNATARVPLDDVVKGEV